MYKLMSYLDAFLISDTYIKILIVLISIISVYGMSVIYESIKTKETK